MIELLIVAAILVVMVAVSIPYFYSYTELYKTEVQALKVMDLMREANQLALNRRRTYRLEIDITTDSVRIIDENGADPDTLVKSIPMESASVVRMDVKPADIDIPNPPDYAAALFEEDEHGHMDGSDTVIGHTVLDLHYKSDGTVVTDADIPISATIFFFPPVGSGSDVASDPKQVRAVTLYGGSGAVRYWKYDGATFAAQ